MGQDVSNGGQIQFSAKLYVFGNAVKQRSSRKGYRQYFARFRVKM